MSTQRRNPRLSVGFSNWRSGNCFIPSYHARYYFANLRPTTHRPGSLLGGRGAVPEGVESGGHELLVRLKFAVVTRFVGAAFIRR